MIGLQSNGRKIFSFITMTPVKLVSKSISRSYSTSISAHPIISPLFGLSEEHQVIYNSAVTFGESFFKSNSREWDSKSEFPRELMYEVGKIGYGGMLVQKDVGGSNLSRKECVIIYEALSKSCVSTTTMISIHNACVSIIDKFGLPEHRLRWVPKLCTMEMMASFCLTEPGKNLGSLVRIF